MDTLLTITSSFAFSVITGIVSSILVLWWLSRRRKNRLAVVLDWVCGTYRVHRAPEHEKPDDPQRLVISHIRDNMLSIVSTGANTE